MCPGWVDVHTHYDGQVTWDPQLSPSGWNGVTTCVFGNCGVGFAPCWGDDRNFLIELMEGVEEAFACTVPRNATPPPKSFVRHPSVRLL